MRLGGTKAGKALGASRKARKSKGKKAADLMTPSSVAKPMPQGESKLRGTGTPTSGDIRTSKVTAANQNKKSKNLTKTMKDLEATKNKLKAYEERRDSLKGINKTKFIAQKSKQITKDKENVKLLKSKIKNMKDRDIVPKMGGGKVIKKNMGGNLKSVNTKKNPGLAKLPTPVRNKMGFAKGGGKVVKKKKSIKAVDRDVSSDQFPEASKFVNKMGGGKIKGYKKGGPITYRMTGGQVVGNSYD